jgi:hypothetical protein
VRAKTVTRSILVTDAIAAAGCAPGRYTIGGVECDLAADGRVSLPGTPYLAGSALTLDRAIANAVRFTGLPIDEVLPMASTTPASYLGMTTVGRVTADWNPDRGTLEIRNVERAEGAPAPHPTAQTTRGGDPAGAERGEGAASPQRAENARRGPHPASDGDGGSGGAKPPAK